MHQQAGTGVDLDNRAALLVQRAGNILRHDIDAGNVQPDDAGRQRDDVIDFRVYGVGAVHGDVAVALDQHLAPGGRNRFGRQALALEFEHDGAVGVGLDLAQRKVFADAAPGIVVELGVDQLYHR